MELLFCLYGDQLVFWPFLCPDGIGFNKYVVDLVYLPTNKSNYISRGTKSVFGNIDLPFKMLALRLDFR